MFKLNNIKSPVGSNHAPKRKGRGIGSGLGKTGGRGHKGQRARTSGNVHQGFEGGQMELQRRSPKVGFNSPLKANAYQVNISDLGFFAGKEVSLKDLLPKTFQARSRVRVSVMGTHAAKSLPKSIQAHHVAPAAKKLLESAGVKIELIEHKDGARVLPRRKKSQKK